MNNYDSLLPPNATKLERDIEQVVANAVDIEIQIQDLWNPSKCPLKLLPWLAWAYSVDFWDDAWSEYIKRQVVADSFEIHKHKGTPYALQRALDSLGIKTNMLEWWEAQANGKRGTMTVVALVNENLSNNSDGLLSSAMLKMITQAIQIYKRGVIHFDVELGLLLNEDIHIAGASAQPIFLKDTEAEFIPCLPGELGLTATFAAGINTVVISDHNFNGVT